MVPYPLGYVNQAKFVGAFHPPNYIADAMTEQNPTEQAKTRLRRIEGQVRGIHGMLDRMGEDPCGDQSGSAGNDTPSGEPCDSLLTQILAVRAAVEQVGLIILELHLLRCVLGDHPLAEEQLHDVRAALKLWSRLT